MQTDLHLPYAKTVQNHVLV